MDGGDEVPEQNGFAAVIKRRALVVFFITLLSVVLSLVYSYTRTPVFEAQAKVRVAAPDVESSPEAGDDGDQSDAARPVQEAIQTLESEPMRTKVGEDMGLGTAPAPAHASATGETGVVAVRVRGPDAGAAASLANGYVTTYVETVRDQARHLRAEAVADGVATIMRLSAQVNEAAPGSDAHETLLDQLTEAQEAVRQRRIEAALETGGASIAELATSPDTPVATNPVRNVVGAAIIGLLLGLAAAFGVDYVARRRQSTDEESDDQR